MSLPTIADGTYLLIAKRRAIRSTWREHVRFEYAVEATSPRVWYEPPTRRILGVFASLEEARAYVQEVTA